MNPKRKLTIELKELPPRAEKLNPDEISKIFGGCQQGNFPCTQKSTKLACCPGLTCTTFFISGPGVSTNQDLCK